VGRVQDRVALITGAARGQGRSHALRLAEEGAHIVALDMMADIDTIPYGMAKEADLAETASLVEERGRRVLTARADVRDQASLDEAVTACLNEFGHIDIVCANAGVLSYGRGHELTDRQWQDVIDIDLAGVWRTLKAVVPPMKDARQGGSIILTSSMAGAKGMHNMAHYAAAKHGVIGLMRSFAAELARSKIRVNSVLPASVNTDMIHNDATYRIFRPDLQDPSLDDAMVGFTHVHPMGVPWIEPLDVSNAVLFLASDEARYITGTALPIDAGYLL